MSTSNRQEPTTTDAQREANLGGARRPIWRRPLYVQIIAAVPLGVGTGLLLPASMAVPLTRSPA